MVIGSEFDILSAGYSSGSQVLGKLGNIVTEIWLPVDALSCFPLWAN